MVLRWVPNRSYGEWNAEDTYIDYLPNFEKQFSTLKNITDNIDSVLFFPVYSKPKAAEYPIFNDDFEVPIKRV